MMKEEYYTISEIAKICHISIRNLRFNDEVGLFKPSKKRSE